MYLFYPDGSPLYINDQYFELLGIERYGHDVKEGWTDAIHPDDLELVQRKWKLVTRDKTPVVFSFRVKKPFKFVNEDDGTEVVGETWLESTIFPETAEDGSCTSVFGSLTEISHQKWAENLQKRRLNEAIEAKRASENFIDMTSHEMRNPLSAILQSADGINSILSTMQAAKDCSEANNDAIEGLAV